MMRFATVACLSIICFAAAPAAEAQTAPVQRGVTSGDLAGQMSDVRVVSSSSRPLEKEIAESNGKVETLEFLLSQSRDEINRLQEDDSRIGSAIESLNAENERLTERVKRLEDDLDTVIAMIESGDTPTAQQSSGEPEGEVDETGGPGGASETRTVTQSSSSANSGGNPGYQGTLGTLNARDLPGEAGPLYAAARNKLLSFDYEGAEVAFRAFIDKFEDDPQAGEALYWLAETLHQQDAYVEAGQAYTRLIREHPDHARAPDALVKLARSMRMVGDLDKACNALEILPKQYPKLSTVTVQMAAAERDKSDCET